jgi:hypothetical protein
MSFPRPLSCIFHPCIPIPDNCATCSSVPVNLEIEIQPPSGISSGNDTTTTTVYENAAEKIKVTGDQASYLWGFMRSGNDRQDEPDDYPERFALDEHERQDGADEHGSQDEADDYPESFALEEHEK